MSGSDWWQIIGFVALVLTQGGVLWRWSIGRQDQLRRDLDEKLTAGLNTTKASVDQCHSRINDVRDQYVRQPDFDRHIARFESHVQALGRELREQHRDMNGRIDNVLTAINSLATNSQAGGHTTKHKAGE